MNDEIYTKEFEFEFKTIKVYTHFSTMQFASNKKFVKYIYNLIKKLNLKEINNEKKTVFPVKSG